MLRMSAPLLLILSLAACGDGQPFTFDGTSTDGSTTGGSTGGGDTGGSTGGTTGGSTTDAAGGNNPDGNTGATDSLNTGTVRPPQSTDLIARGDIIRAEAAGEGSLNGRVAAVQYIPLPRDNLIVDGLGFDGENTYSRGDPISQLGAAFQVYEADIIAPDFLTGDPIDQVRPFRAIYGVSNNSLDSGEPRTSLAIVRTGDFTGFGFGGYIYERNGNVVLPETGQAIFTGTYAGVRVFSGRDGMELTQGDMEIAIDFRDFNDNNAVRGEITNRQAFNIDGSPVALGGDGGLLLPRLPFSITVGGTDIQPNGEFSGRVANSILSDTGSRVTYEEGNYYAVIAGDTTDPADGGEIVGILVVESLDPRYQEVTAQETGGFIVYR